MRPLILKMSLSLDGFAAGPNGELDWIFRNSHEAITAWLLETLGAAGVHIMGSRTFADMNEYWPTSTHALAPPMNAIPKVVFSRRSNGAAAHTTTALRDAVNATPEAPQPNSKAIAEWRSTPIASGDLREEIARLKSQAGKPILAHGGASFAQSLVEQDLVDEYQFLIHPIILGRGLPIFCKAHKLLDLKLVSSTAFPTGVIANVYRRAGER